MPKTIRDLTQDEIEKYWEALKKREDREKEFLRERFKDAWSVAIKASEILYKKYQGVCQVFCVNFLGISYYRYPPTLSSK